MQGHCEELATKQSFGGIEIYFTWFYSFGLLRHCAPRNDRRFNWVSFHSLGLLRHSARRNDSGSKTNFTCVTKRPPLQGGRGVKRLGSEVYSIGSPRHISPHTDTI